MGARLLVVGRRLDKPREEGLRGVDQREPALGFRFEGLGFRVLGFRV